MTDFSPELLEKMETAHQHMLDGKTVLFLFADMVEINDHFQAALDWFKKNGNKPRHRYGQGAFMTHGMAYFVGADTHIQHVDGVEQTIPTRGVAIELDMRPHAHELIRETGLDALLRKQAAAEAPRTECCGAVDRAEPRCSDCPAVEAAA